MLGFLNPFISFPIHLHVGVTGSLFLLLQGAVFGILPDMDLFLKGVLDHRCGLTHSLISVLVLFPLLATLLQASPLVGFFCTFSHWVSDAITFQGVRTYGVSPSFFLGHKCDFRLAKFKSNSKIANSLLCLASLLVLGALI
jgi:membrane-bound metal-dependent hydrolase YbcI (DUF457 family)